MALIVAATARAQDSTGSLVGHVLFQGRGVGVPFASVTLTPTGGSRFADSTGAFAFGRLPPGTYHARARQIGFNPADTTVQVRAGTQTSITLSLRRLVRLRQVTVRAKGPKECLSPGIPDSLVDPELYQLFSQVKENVARLRILMNSYPFRYRREDVYMVRQAGPDQLVETDTVDIPSWDDEKYQPGEVVVNGTHHGQPSQFMHLVQFQDIGDPAFVETHCFHIVPRDKSDSSVNPPIRIDFQPWVKLLSPDVRGSVFLDPERLIVLHAEFHLTRPYETSPAIRDWTYYSAFHEVVPLVPVVSGFQSYVQIPRQPGVMVEDGRVLDYSFIQEAPVNPAVHDTLAGATASRTIVGQAEFPEAEHPCTLPISQTVVQALTGMVIAPQDASGDPAWPRAARKLLTDIRGRLDLPTTLGLVTFGYPAAASAADAAGRGALRIAPGIFGRYALTFDNNGVATDVRIVATSLSGDVDSAVVIAARFAHNEHFSGQTVVLALSTTQPADTASSLSLVHMQVPSWLQTRPVMMPPATRATPSPAALRTPDTDTATVEFVVDPEGHAILSTVHRVGVPSNVLAGTQMDALTLAADDSLSTRTYWPALIGRCPVTRIHTQQFVFRRQ
ncbi:MAG TPA: carboxypeptidase-like regulatory domain-containing protein [Gemmatimonadaceae bacterium]|nr:carboxypeptidase-like regulatory domain-containing protein [Gemmatimonadaceae bacterium]